MEDSKGASAYIRPLDALRGVAILLVLWRHSVTVTMQGADAGHPYYFDVYYNISIIGSYGVILFFVLSGFLITGILIRTVDDPKCLKKFYIRRSLRIFPLYFVALLSLIILSFVLSDDFYIGRDVALHFLYIQNWFFLTNDNGAKILYTGHFWTLAVEEQFYVFWPFLFLFLFRKCSSKIITITLLSLVFCSMLMRHLAVTDIASWWAAYSFTLYRLDAILAGALLAFLWDRNKGFKRYASSLGRVVIPIMAVIIILLIVVTIVLSKSIVIISTSVLIGLAVVLCFFVIACILSNHEKGAGHEIKILQSNVLVRIGCVSYGFYVFHYPVMHLLQRCIVDFGWGLLMKSFFLLFVGGGISYVMALLSYKYFESPILSLKNKYAPYH